MLFTALAFGKPLLLSDVGGFPEVAATGAARTVPAGDSAALGEALRSCWTIRPPSRRWRRAHAPPRRGPYSWEAIAPAHLELYERLLAWLALT